MSSQRKTLAELRLAVRNVCDEPSASFWSESQLTSYINRAKDRVWQEVNKLRDDYFALDRTSLDGTVTIFGASYATSSFAIVAGTRTYSLPPDMNTIRLIECITSTYEDVSFAYRGLDHPDMIAARAIVDRMPPTCFYFHVLSERTLTIAPLSDTALDLRLIYIPIIADLSAESDELEMKHPLYEAVVCWAASLALRQDRNLEMAGAWEQSARAVIADAIGAHSRQEKDPIFIRAYLGEYTGNF